MKLPSILVIDDDQAILNFLNIFLLQTGKFTITTLQDSSEAFAILEKETFDILLLDMDMPHVSGLDIIRYIAENNINIITVVLTGVEDVDLAISAMKLGTSDYMFKPIEEEKLLPSLDDLLETRQIENMDQTSDAMPLSISGLEHPDVFKNILTQDEKMIRLFYTAEKFATTDNSVLIWGESGTGKELIARAIHQISHRRNNKFLAINAGTFANDLFSSEFFGHTKGSFTGALDDKKGFFEEANNGTLFLDEIGELSLPIQVKLLRVLQEEEFFRLGSTKNIKVNVRIIAATNKNLFEEINKGNFRKDLFFRLNINSISIPPLREKSGDIAFLANHFLKQFNKKYSKNIKRISKPLLTLLKNYPFPGNIRELMNLLNSAIIVESGDELSKKSLPHYFLENTHSLTNSSKNGILPKNLQEIERDHIKKVLEYTNQNKTNAAKILGISRLNLIAKIKKYGL